jgi:pyruvate dehydrogenase E2 component (dihydrolipoamide acetyltransferase)
MAIPIFIPKLGLTMTEATIAEWKKKEGDKVEKGEILVVIETEKITFEVESPDSGILGKILSARGDVVPVGQVIGQILLEGEMVPGVLRVETVSQETGPPPIEKIEKVDLKSMKISPLAKKMALEHGIEISTVKGTGPEGRIIKEDVLRTIEEKKRGLDSERVKAEVVSTKDKVIRLSGMRRTIAKRMTESFQSAPHFYLSLEVDAQELSQVLGKLEPRREAKAQGSLTYTDLMIKIVAQALEQHPEMNATWTGDGIKLLSEIHIGVAMAVQDGLLVPVIRQANHRSIAEIAEMRIDFMDRAKNGKLGLDEITGSSFTITNMGMLGIQEFHGIINPPEAAILSIGSIIEKPVVIDEKIVIRPRMLISLSVDHRILDGASAARFFITVKDMIENPLLLIA